MPLTQLKKGFCIDRAITRGKNLVREALWKQKIVRRRCGSGLLWNHLLSVRPFTGQTHRNIPHHRLQIPEASLPSSGPYASFWRFFKRWYVFPTLVAGMFFSTWETANAGPGADGGIEVEDSRTLLVIFDGNDPGGYDAYHDLTFTDGVLRKEIIERTQPTFAVDAESLEEALNRIASMGIPPGSLDRIAIVDHGDVEKDPPIQTLGDERLKPRDFRKFRELLKPEGDICLYGCKVGKNVRYLKKISRYLNGRKVWAYAGVLSYNREDPSPLADPDSSLFFYYPMSDTN